MAKANRNTDGHKDRYKIPICDRKSFMGSNREKWVNRDKYREYLVWRKKQK